MLIDFKLNGKTVIVVGGGAEAYRKTQSFLDSGATIWVISKGFSEGIKKLSDEKKVILLSEKYPGAITNPTVLRKSIIKVFKEEFV